MPVAGDWPTSLNNPNEQLWSVALQLVEAVAFMHERKVAHVDLKPQNVNIPPEGGRLSIIDLASPFVPVVQMPHTVGLSARKTTLLRRFARDSTSRCSEELRACRHSSADRTKLLEIARRLMKRDLEARPKMSTVLEWMAPRPTRRGQCCTPRYRRSRSCMVLHCTCNCLQGFSDSISISPLRLNDLPSNYEHKRDIPLQACTLSSLEPVRAHVGQVTSLKLY